MYPPNFFTSANVKEGGGIDWKVALQGLSWEFETAGANHYSKSSKFKGETQHYVVKLPKSAGARH